MSTSQNRRKQNGSWGIVLLLLTCMLLTGCGSKQNSLMEYRPQMPAAAPVQTPKTESSDDGTETGSQQEEGAEDTIQTSNISTSNFSLEYLSQDICVIPKKEQSPKNSDSVMTAGASLIVNDTTDEMLFSRNIYKKMYPASITKIVTALVTLKNANLDDMVTVSHNAANITEYGATLCGFKEGDQIKLKRLLYSLLICSGNDAGIAIAEHVAGSEEAFAEMMNQEMKDLGASGSHFTNSHGLHDEQHYTTAYDMYLVFHELLQYDTFLDIINRSSYKAKYKGADGKSKTLQFQSTDRYLIGRASAPKGIKVIGGKTGTTSAAGSCLILYSHDASEQDFISIVLHAEGPASLYLQMNKLLEYIPKE
ncbi:MAG: serine hydrolase [Lachnospiraceae bacterium]|nr:serine hydrolase [Lachnospiraceae bacterium]